MPELRYDLLPTALGWVGVLASERGLRATTLPLPSPDEALAHLGPEARRAQHRPGAFAMLHDKLRRYLTGEPIAFNETLDMDGATPFFRAAWEACQGILRGETRSYGWLAAQAGRPGAARAAGQAMARNRFPLIVPCHRVVGANGGLCGFGGGLEMKRHLLELEKSGR